MVNGVRIAPLDAAHRPSGEGRLQPHHAVGVGAGVVHGLARERERLRDVCGVVAEPRGRGLVAREIVASIRQPQAPFVGDSEVPRRLHRIGHRPEIEGDIDADRLQLCDLRLQLLEARHVAYPRQLWIDWRHPGRLDRRGVQTARVKITDLLEIAPRRSVGARGVLQDGAEALFRSLLDHIEGAPAIAIRRDGLVFSPGTDGVLVEVVGGRHGGIEVVRRKLPGAVGGERVSAEERTGDEYELLHQHRTSAIWSPAANLVRGGTVASRSQTPTLVVLEGAEPREDDESAESLRSRERG